MNYHILIYIAVMALVTYGIRMIPFVLMRKKIESRFVKDLLYYVPYAVLGAMTIPAVLYSTGSMVSAAAGLIIAVILAFKNKSLLTVAAAACLAAFAADLIMEFVV
jgi:branched-subunit amino acid transport protein